ncbi:IS701 family transposase [Lichenibacterium dinghuense]|uniref:IS701 family transposase n=1 Tax=Lichenibacterium dinghuense TaxID=2895977 RepID=UPI001F16DFB5|nr:transposase [Lichenibacterium sp. 6Y81]
MRPHRQRPPSDLSAVPAILSTWLTVLRPCFTAPVWTRVLVLVAGAVLSPGGRTVTQALRVMGLAGKPGFGRYHDVLSRARWDARDVARRLLGHLVAVLSPDGEVIIGIDDTVERRWGPKIAARGIYRDPVRSSKGHFVKTSGLRWLVLAVMLPVPFAGRRWALPFLTVLAPSERWSEAHRQRHKTLTDWARQAILQSSRWLGSRRVTVVADSSFAALDLIAAVRRHVTLITRLRLDANLFEPAPARVPGRRGRPALKGKRVPKLDAVLRDPATVWTKVTLTEWYGGQTCRLEYTSATALWSKAGLPPQPIRWVLVRDPSGTRDAQAFLCTDADLTAEAILTRFVMRWRIETTFQEVRRHLGVETQRQWSDKAILRTTPALLALYSLVTLWAHELHTRAGPIRPQTAAWYDKRLPTFSDALADVRRALWWPQISSTSPPSRDPVKIHPDLLDRWIDTLCRAA